MNRESGGLMTDEPTLPLARKRLAVPGSGDILASHCHEVSGTRLVLSYTADQKLSATPYIVAWIAPWQKTFRNYETFATEAEDRATRAAVNKLGKKRHGERAAGLQRDDAVCFPPTQHVRHPAITSEMLPSLAEWKRVRVAERQAVTHVEIRTSTFGGDVVTVLRKVRISGATEKI